MGKLKFFYCLIKSLVRGFLSHAPEILRKNDNLLDRMDQLKIVSEGTNPDIKTASSRRMPEERRKNQLETIYGHVEPDRIPIGRMSMQQVVESLVDFSKDRETMTPSAISNAYRIDAEKAALLTKYYRVFDIHLPKGAVDTVTGKQESLQAPHLKYKLLGEKVKPES